MTSHLDGKIFSPLDRHFARFIAQVFGEERKEALLAAARLLGIKPHTFCKRAKKKFGI